MPTGLRLTLLKRPSKLAVSLLAKKNLLHDPFQKYNGRAAANNCVAGYMPVIVDESGRQWKKKSEISGTWPPGSRQDLVANAL